MPVPFNDYVSTRYHIYNSLFLNLPFSHIYRTGTLLPFVQQYTIEGFEQGKDPQYIIQRFFDDFAPDASREEKFELLFNFIQYAERQVVLFDSIEDAAFDKINDLQGKGTLSSLLLRASSADKQARLKKKLETFSVRVVLTAHPTQFYPGPVLAIINDLEEAIRQDNLSDINLLLNQLGKTAIIKREKPTPFDEAVSLCWYLENIFYQAAPEILLKVMDGLQVHMNDWKNFDLIRVGFWPGGDRDGNPFVTSEVTLKVAARLRETILKCYYRDVRVLRRRLTFRGIEKLVQEVERKVYNAIYRPSEGYLKASELIRDLEEIKKNLLKEHQGLFLNRVDSFLVKVKMFGFFFASMDVRQDSRKHAQAWNDILRALKVNLGGKPEKEQVTKILKLKFQPNKLRLRDPFVRDLVQSVYTIGTIQTQNGEPACHRYVISNCASVLDVIKVFQLLRLAIGTKKGLSADVVPLFETIDDLAHAGTIMEALYRIPEYRRHIRSRGNKQTIMLGFSDGTKDGGYLRANWSIFRAKENLTGIARKHGITVVFFDGRGGPPARGGGNTHDFYASLGSSIEDHEVQITIQGQTISSNFGKVPSCRYNLEQLLSAGVERAVFNDEQEELTKEDKALLEELAEVGYKAYLDLKHHARFVPYLERATPLVFYGDSNIGSRPVKRNSSEGLKFEDLRAIPFVGAWALMKQNIPGFYGVGQAIEIMQTRGATRRIRSLYQRSLFFKTLLNNSMMSLMKTNFQVTSYLAGDHEFGDFWKGMYAEYLRSSKQLLMVTGLDDLMENNPVNRESILLRERIVMPLIVIQQYGLQHLRSGDDKKYQAYYQKLVLRCMFGIINAARNSA
ncbi:MAG: phosphoenolpyruvate carboxylase [Cyclobacteriaceae bacterium]